MRVHWVLVGSGLEQRSRGARILNDVWDKLGGPGRRILLRRYAAPRLPVFPFDLDEVKKGLSRTGD